MEHGRIKVFKSDAFSYTADIAVFQAIFWAGVSYLVTIYGFAIVYRLLSIFYNGAFDAKITDLATAIYFSIVTMATVGYGDIVPKEIYSRVAVGAEILLSVAFSVFFFAIVAGSLRETLAPQAPHD